MHARAEALIRSLQLAPHPEGGYFREVYRSYSRVQPSDARTARAALTTIYFLLTAGQVSRWHRVASDEAWHFYEGDALQLFTADADFTRVTSRTLGRVDESGTDAARFVHVVPAGEWQASRSTGSYTLVGCTVAPGFEFQDFQLIGAAHDEVERIRRAHPDAAGFL